MPCASLILHARPVILASCRLGRAGTRFNLIKWPALDVLNKTTRFYPSVRPLASMAAKSIERLADKLEAPALDDRSYRVIRLPNKLEALLVHDPETDKASASVSVDVGSLSDADDMPGMAHAVEHLLFMGTKKVSLLRSQENSSLTLVSSQRRTITTNT